MVDHLFQSFRHKSRPKLQNPFRLDFEKKNIQREICDKIKHNGFSCMLKKLAKIVHGRIKLLDLIAKEHECLPARPPGPK